MHMGVGRAIPNDQIDIYFFGFSRGAYVARFLAEMLDHVGLLSAGNEELVSYAIQALLEIYILIPIRLALRGKLSPVGNNDKNLRPRKKRSGIKCSSSSKVGHPVYISSNDRSLIPARFSRNL